MKLDEVQKSMLKIGGIAVAVGILYYITFSVIGVFPPCLFNKISGLLCPGCGLTRMCLYMIKLDFKSAYEANRCVFVFMWIWAAYGITVFIGKPKILRNKRIINTIVYVTVIAFLIWGILRNI